MNQIDNRETTFRYNLGDGAFISGVGGVVTLVCKDLNIKAQNINVQADAIKVQATTIDITGDTKVTGNFTTTGGVTRLN